MEGCQMKDSWKERDKNMGTNSDAESVVDRRTGFETEDLVVSLCLHIDNISSQSAISTQCARPSHLHLQRAKRLTKKLSKVDNIHLTSLFPLFLHSLLEPFDTSSPSGSRSLRWVSSVKMAVCVMLSGSRMTGGKGAGRRRAASDAGSVWMLNSEVSVHWGMPVHRDKEKMGDVVSAEASGNFLYLVPTKQSADTSTYQTLRP